jgi:hypothetical protein
LGTTNNFPFYYNPGIVSTGCARSKEDGSCSESITQDNALNFLDVPTNPALNPARQSECKVNDKVPCFSTLASFAAFTTRLVGVRGSNTPGPSLFTWTWKSTFNGTAGGVARTYNTKPVDPGSGTGGVTITGVNGVTLSPQSATAISTTASGLAYSRVSKTFNGTVTLTNISGRTLNGPFQIVFMPLTTGVTVANSTGSFVGNPYITVPGVLNLGPGQSATVNVQFKNPLNATINFTPAIYSGSLN